MFEKFFHAASSLARLLYFLIGVLYFPLDAFQFALLTLAGKVNYSLLAVLVRSFFGGVNAFDNYRVTTRQSVGVGQPYDPNLTS
jgi:cellulose synthase/poly-beta-1,6-N-acetylglucosamine synthase-like glycosyltransferase